MTIENLYSARAYKKVLFFTLIKISIFFCFTAQIQGETDDFDYCRNSYEMYALNLSDKNTLEATETCIQAFESKFIGIEEYLERLESFGSGLENSDLYLYNKYKFECTFYDGLNKKIDCKSLKNLFLEQTKNGVDTYLYELYHDESIIRENLEGEWEDNYLNLRDSAISDESRDLIKKIGSFNCEFFDESTSCCRWINSLYHILFFRHFRFFRNFIYTNNNDNCSIYNYHSHSDFFVLQIFAE